MFTIKLTNKLGKEPSCYIGKSFKYSGIEYKIEKYEVKNGAVMLWTECNHFYRFPAFLEDIGKGKVVILD